MEPYLHKVQYYETDKMGVVHHSNYLHWFEEARLDFLDRIGASYFSLEQRGYTSPVLSIQMDYISSVRFGETVNVSAKLTEIRPVRYKFSYSVEDSVTGAVRAIGESVHCFLDKDGKILAFKRDDSALYDLFKAHMENR
ncbi:MAG: acyl-CoA thioesterase [Oscillospiraceae bacterium]